MGERQGMGPPDAGASGIPARLPLGSTLNPADPRRVQPPLSAATLPPYASASLQLRNPKSDLRAPPLATAAPSIQALALNPPSRDHGAAPAATAASGGGGERRQSDGDEVALLRLQVQQLQAQLQSVLQVMAAAMPAASAAAAAAAAGIPFPTPATPLSLLPLPPPPPPLPPISADSIPLHHHHQPPTSTDCVTPAATRRGPPSSPGRVAENHTAASTLPGELSPVGGVNGPSSGVGASAVGASQWPSSFAWEDDASVPEAPPSRSRPAAGEDGVDEGRGEGFSTAEKGAAAADPSAPLLYGPSGGRTGAAAMYDGGSLFTPPCSHTVPGVGSAEYGQNQRCGPGLDGSIMPGREGGPDATPVEEEAQILSSAGVGGTFPSASSAMLSAAEIIRNARRACEALR